MDPEKRESFVSAFADQGRCRGECACGKTYYDGSDRGISWEPGELEKLEADGVGLGCSVSILTLEGKEYVSECDCWLPKGQRVIDYLDHYACQIAVYLTEEKKRKQRVADRSPVVGE